MYEHPTVTGGLPNRGTILKQKLSEGVLDKSLARELKRLLKE